MNVMVCIIQYFGRLFGKLIDLFTFESTESDELLSQSPAHMTTLTVATDIFANETILNSGTLKKSVVILNGNSNAIGDVAISSGEY